MRNHQDYLSIYNMSEKFCLKWNDFHSNVSKSFGLFRNEDYLHDVTLVSDDHNKIPAHKLVLSACSEYFRDIFKNNQHSHPLLCLDGISSGDLRNILDYIYNGQVEIYPDNLDRFLVIAQRLKLEGLTKSNDFEEDEGTENEKLKNENIVEEEVNYIENETTENHSSTTERYKRGTSRDRSESLVKTIAALASNDDLNEINEKVNQYMEESSDGGYRCNVCGKTSRTNLIPALQKHNMMKHIETHIDGLTFNCPICQKTFRSRNSLSSHKSQNHKN